MLRNEEKTTRNRSNWMVLKKKQMKKKGKKNIRPRLFNELMHFGIPPYVCKVHFVNVNLNGMQDLFLFNQIYL